MLLQVKANLGALELLLLDLLRCLFVSFVLMFPGGSLRLNAVFLTASFISLGKLKHACGLVLVLYLRHILVLQVLIKSVFDLANCSSEEWTHL